MCAVVAKLVSWCSGLPYAAPQSACCDSVAGTGGPLAGRARCTDFMPLAPVVERDPTENNNSVMAEDCLGINVWTPAVDRSRRPVMVFIHGGAFIEGSARNSWYDGSELVRRGNVVIVTLQYRLGALGFLELSQVGGAEYAARATLGSSTSSRRSNGCGEISRRSGVTLATSRCSASRLAPRAPRS